jgi:hypothetical protein
MLSEERDSDSSLPQSREKGKLYAHRFRTFGRGVDILLPSPGFAGVGMGVRVLVG